MRVDFPAPDGAEITNSLPFLMFITNLVDEGRKQGCVSILRVFLFPRIPADVRVQYGMRVGRKMGAQPHQAASLSSTCSALALKSSKEMNCLSAALVMRLLSFLLRFSKSS